MRAWLLGALAASAGCDLVWSFDDAGSAGADAGTQVDAPLLPVCDPLHGWQPPVPNNTAITLLPLEVSVVPGAARAVLWVQPFPLLPSDPAPPQTTLEMTLDPVSGWVTYAELVATPDVAVLGLSVGHGGDQLWQVLRDKNTDLETIAMAQRDGTGWAALAPVDTLAMAGEHPLAIAAPQLPESPPRFVLELAITGSTIFAEYQPMPGEAGYIVRASYAPSDLGLMEIHDPFLSADGRVLLFAGRANANVSQAIYVAVRATPDDAFASPTILIQDTARGTDLGAPSMTPDCTSVHYLAHQATPDKWFWERIDAQ